MIRFAKSANARRIIQGAATVLTVTMALTVRVEHSCSDEFRPRALPSAAILYAVAEISTPIHSLEWRLHRVRMLAHTPSARRDRPRDQ
jgi:hypothetical protein